MTALHADHPPAPENGHAVQPGPLAISLTLDSNSQEQRLLCTPPSQLTGPTDVGSDTVSEVTDFIAVMGPTGTGKTSFINTATESQRLEVSHGFESCTREVQLSDPFQFQDRKVVFIDTPGFDDSDTDRSDADVLRMIARFLTEVSLNKQHLAGVVYLKDISQVRMSGSACNNLHLFKKLCGEDSLHNVAIVTTMWSRVRENEGKARQQNLENDDKYFGDMIKGGAAPFRYRDTPASAHQVLEHILTKRPTELKIQRELVMEKKEFASTEAGKELGRQLNKKAGRIESRLVQLDEEVMEAAMENNEKALLDAEAEIAKYRRDLERVKAEKQNLRDGFTRGLAAGVAIIGAAGLVVAGVATGKISLDNAKHALPAIKSAF